MSFRTRLILAGALLTALAVAGGLLYVSRDLEREARQAIAALQLAPGNVVAEIGAGKGALAIETARFVGPPGRVIATELDTGLLATIRKRAGDAGLHNVVAVEAGEHDARLEPGCCDAVYMRNVYHHFSDPVPIMAGVFGALKPGGRILIIDFEPRWWLGPWKPNGAPESRGGHGMPRGLLVEELRKAGFEVTREYPAWAMGAYAVAARKKAG